MQVSTGAEDTIEVKRAFEIFVARHGVRIKHYHSNNGVFCSRAFTDNLERCGQYVTYIGVNSCHQNVVVERRIRDILDHALSSLLHASGKWPKLATVNL